MSTDTRDICAFYPGSNEDCLVHDREGCTCEPDLCIDEDCAFCSIVDPEVDCPASACIVLDLPAAAPAAVGATSTTTSEGAGQ